MPEPSPGDPRLGAALYAAGIFFFAANDALGKWLVGTYGVAQLMALRGLGALVVLLPALWLARRRLTGPRQTRLQALRVVISALDTFCFYAATRALPLADVMAFYLAGPLIVVALSSVTLGERVGPRRWMAVLAGFAGVLVALHPTGAALSGGALVALLGCLAFSTGIVITRQLRATHWLELVAYQVIGSGLIGALGAPFDWATPTGGDLALMALVGLVSMGSFMCITKALAIAPASLVAPIQYTSILWATLFGWLVWGDVPGAPVAIGSVIIMASGVLVMRRERVVAVP